MQLTGNVFSLLTHLIAVQNISYQTQICKEYLAQAILNNENRFIISVLQNVQDLPIKAIRDIVLYSTSNITKEKLLILYQTIKSYRIILPQEAFGQLLSILDEQPILILSILKDEIAVLGDIPEELISNLFSYFHRNLGSIEPLWMHIISELIEKLNRSFEEYELLPLLCMGMESAFHVQEVTFYVFQLLLRLPTWKYFIVPPLFDDVLLYVADVDENQQELFFEILLFQKTPDEVAQFREIIESICPMLTRYCDQPLKNYEME